MAKDFKGYELTGTQLKNVRTKQFETVYILRDESKFVGIFDDESFADRFWNRVYIPSKRKETQENNTYEMKL